MSTLKQKEKAPSATNLQFKKNVQIALLAALVAIGACILVWNLLLKPHNQKVFDAAVATTADEYQQIVTAFVDNVQAELLNAGRQLGQSKSQSQQSIWALTERDDFSLQQSLKTQGNYVVDVQLFSAEALAPDRIDQNPLSYIEIDLLNKAARNVKAFPEAVKQASNGQWLIHWAVPVVNEAAPNFVQAALLFKTSTGGLQTALAQAKSASLKIDLLQSIGRSGENVFYSEGTGASNGEQTRDVAGTYWQVKISPSSAFAAKQFEFPLWIMALMLAIVALCVAPVVRVFTQPVVEEPVDPNLQMLRDKYRKKSERDNAAQTPESADAADSDNPFDLGENAQNTMVDTRPEGMVNESFVVPDNIFRAYDIRGAVGEDLSFDLARLIGQAVASEALSAGEKAMLVAFDARTHSPEFAHHLTQGIISTGCDVINIGLVPTPLLHFATIFNEHTSSGVIVTASHNPKTDNGFKIIIGEKSLKAQDLQTIKQRITGANFVRGEAPGNVSQIDIKEDYIDTILADIAVGPETKIVIDAANGATSELAPALFKDLGCEVVPLYCEFDGEFPNHSPDPCNEQNLQALIKTVVEQNATLGVAFDGDGDRLVVVTPKGQIIWPDQLLMIFVKDVVARNPGCDVVFDIKSTRHLSPLIASYGGRPVMWKTGHSHIKNKMLETDALLAGEFSGHIFFKERWFGFDDGMYATARLLEILSLCDDILDDLLAQLPTSVSTGEIKIAVNDSRKHQFIERLIDESQFESGEKTLIDGMRVDFAKGWGLVRASNKVIEKLKAIFKREINKVDSQLQLDF